ncbi:hypothetical protein GCM10018954_037800 [Kutzneria kofuensis]
MAELWRDGLAEASRAASWESRPPWRGVPALRDALGRLVDFDQAAEFLVTGGIRPLIGAFALTGRRVVVERPSFEGVATAFRRCGARVLRADIDQALRLARPAGDHLLWITSPWRNPDGWSLDPDVVERLADFVRRGGMLVQNETYRLFSPSTSPAPARVPGAFVAGSLTKAAGPWSRLGWLIAPAVPGPVEAHLRASAPPTLWQEAWALFAAAGGFDRLGRRAAAVGALTDRTAAALGGPVTGGTSLLVSVNSSDPVALLRRRFGLLVGSGTDFAAPNTTARLCFLGCSPECDHVGVEALVRSGAARIVHGGRKAGRPLERGGAA